MLSDGDFSLLQTLQHWVLWNSFIEATAEWIFRLEDIDIALIREIHSRAQETPSCADASRVPPLPDLPTEADMNARMHAISKKTNAGHTSKPTKPLEWGVLMALDAEYTLMAQIMALRYGYASAYNGTLAAAHAHAEGMVQLCGFRAKSG